MPFLVPYIPTILAVGSAVYTGIAVKKSTDAQIAASEAQTEAMQEQTNIAIAGNRLQSFNTNTSRSTERRKLLRNEQVMRAQTIAAGASVGGLGSSGLSGGIGSLSSSVGGALGEQARQHGISTLGSGIQTAGAQRVGELNVKAQEYSNQAAMWGARSKIGMSVFNLSGGFGSIANGFSMATAPKADPKGTG